MSRETFVTGQFRWEVTHFFTTADILAPPHHSRDDVSPRAPFHEQLAGAQRANHSLLCVGLDPLPEAMPNAPQSPADVLAFCCAVVDAVADVVSAFKPQHAHFAAAITAPSSVPVARKRCSMARNVSSTDPAGQSSGA